MHYYLYLLSILAYVLIVTFVRRETSLETFDLEEKSEFGDMFEAKVENLKALEKETITSVIKAGYIDPSFEKYLIERNAKELKVFKKAVFAGKVDMLYMIDFICKECKRSDEFKTFIIFEDKCKENARAYDKAISELYEDLKQTKEYKFVFSYYQKFYQRALEDISRRNDDQSYENAERLLAGINDFTPSSDKNVIEIIQKYKNPKKLLTRNMLDEMSFEDARNIGIARSKVTLVVSAQGNKIKNLEYIPAKNMYIYNVLKFGQKRRKDETRRYFKNLFALKLYAKVFIKDKTVKSALKKCYE